MAAARPVAVNLWPSAPTPDPDGALQPAPLLANRRLEPSPSFPFPMPRGDKSAYTGKQKRQAAHIEKGYEKRGVSARTAKSRAWATVNKRSGGGKKRTSSHRH